VTTSRNDKGGEVVAPRLTKAEWGLRPLELDVTATVKHQWFNSGDTVLSAVEPFLWG
jgi:hypothetical protein